MRMKFLKEGSLLGGVEVKPFLPVPDSDYKLELRTLNFFNWTFFNVFLIDVFYRRPNCVLYVGKRPLVIWKRTDGTTAIVNGCLSIDFAPRQGKYHQQIIFRGQDWKDLLLVYFH
jgi:hypothetical protein